MADKSTQLILDALGRAAAEPAGLPLHAGKTAPGLFPATAPARLAAQRCKDDGLLRVVRAEGKGKTAGELCALTEKGLAFLLQQLSPRQVLEDLVRVLEARREQAAALLETARAWSHALDALKGTVEKVLQQLHAPAPATASANGSETWLAEALTWLRQRHAPGDCPLPELYRQARAAAPTLSIGHFHDGLRRLIEQGQIYLHPWTGPLYDLPEPTLALLVGHEIAYYASARAPHAA